MDDNKAKALAAALSQIEKQFGKGSIMRLGENDISQDIQVVSTGSLGLDLALGIGGLPRGRIVEIYGPESSGKTTFCLSVIAEWQGAYAGYGHIRRMIPGSGNLAKRAKMTGIDLKKWSENRRRRREEGLRDDEP